MDRVDYKSWTAAGWRGTIARHWDWGDRGDPLVWVQSPEAHAEPVRQRPGGCVWCAELDGQIIYLKHLRAPKDRPVDRLGWLDRFKWRFGGSRAMAVLRVHKAMRSAGLHVPLVLLAARRQHGEGGADRAGWPEELLVTAAVDAPSLRVVLRDGDERTCREALRRVGGAMAALHRARFVHGDPTPGNTLVPRNAEPCWLDNDRTRRWPRVPRALRLRNVAAIAGRALVRRPWRDVALLLEAYRHGMGMTADARWRRDRLHVIRRIRRAERRGGRKRYRDSKPRA